MNANELRVGNWYSQFDNLHQVTWDTIKALGDAPETQLWCKPIPLSPEILEKCGLEVINGHHVFRNGRYVIIPMSNAYTLFLNKIESAPDFMELITGFNYLHQLQNLYFALCGEELTYNQ